MAASKGSSRKERGGRSSLPSPRSLARRVAVQALYQQGMTEDVASELLTEFATEKRLGRADPELFSELVRGVLKHRVALDEHIDGLAERGVEQLDPVERAILRLGAFELEQCPSVPSRVVVNEAVELAHLFGAEASHRYVNAVLDALARRLRPTEFQ